MAEYWCRPLDVPPDCWQIDPDRRAYASFHLDGVEYGVDDVVIGRVILIMNWTLSGAVILARPIQVRNTRAMTSTVFRGYVMDGGRNVVGSTKNRCKDGRFGVSPAGDSGSGRRGAARCTTTTGSSMRA
jgi:hypothetical protein